MVKWRDRLERQTQFATVADAERHQAEVRAMELGEAANAKVASMRDFHCEQLQAQQPSFKRQNSRKEQ